MRQSSPSALRNRDVILDVLKRVFPSSPQAILEIASGSGEHAVHFAKAMPQHQFIASDQSEYALASIGAWIAEEALGNVELRRLDVMEEWPDLRVDIVLCINMIHISPWEASEALFDGASRVLREGGLLVTYGPYRIDGEQTSESNARFEEWLKARDPRYGVRDMGALEEVAKTHGFALEERVAMPANNFTLVWRQK